MRCHGGAALGDINSQQAHQRLGVSMSEPSQHLDTGEDYGHHTSRWSTDRPPFPFCRRQQCRRLVEQSSMRAHEASKCRVSRSAKKTLEAAALLPRALCGARQLRREAECVSAASAFWPRPMAADDSSFPVRRRINV